MRKIYVHPLPVRIWHWINATSVVSLIVTGIQIRYVGLIDLMSLSLAVALHNWIGFILMANFFLWLSFYLFTDKISVYHPDLNPKRYYRDAIRQARFYGYGIFRGTENPHRMSPYDKFNALQRVSYQIIMLLVIPAQLFTGLLLWDVTRFSWLVDLLGGVRIVDTVHVLIFIFFVFFLFIHVYLATLGHTPTAHIKAMFTGYEDQEEEVPSPVRSMARRNDRGTRDRETLETPQFVSGPPRPLQIH